MRRIFVVDDSAMMHSYMRIVLARMRDFEVTFFRNGREALDGIAAAGRPGLILLDVNMPVMNGLEFLGKMRELGLIGQIPTILVTTEGTEADVLAGLEAGARAYLRKPFKPQELLQVIERVLG
jgi:two-component system chemotaxis response regulator CheY